MQLSSSPLKLIEHIAALVCLCLPLGGIFASNAEAKTIFDKSFGLRSTITFISADASDTGNLVIHLSESYSLEQKRAKIYFKLVDLGGGTSSTPAKLSQPSSSHQAREPHSDSGEIVYDASKDIAVFVPLKQGKCQILSGIQVTELLQLPLPEEPTIERGEQLFVGTARLLLFLSRKKLVLQNLGLAQTVRNVRCTSYTYNHVAKPPQASIKFTVFISEIAHAANVSAFPLQVIMELDDGRTVSVDLAQMEPLPGEPLLPGDLRSGHQTSADSATSTLDRWAFAPLAGCARELLNMDKSVAPLASWREANSGQGGARFSFRAKHEFVPPRGAPPIVRHLYVAYDAFIGSLRLDYSRASEQKQATLAGRPTGDQLDESGGTDYERRLINYKQARAYHVLESASSSSTNSRDATPSSQADGFPSSEPQRAPVSSKCVVLALPAVEQNASSGLETVSKLITGTENYVYLGRATVRGIEVELFERDHERLELPSWLDAAGLAAPEMAFGQQPGPSGAYTTLLYAVPRGLGRMPIRVEFYARAEPEAKARLLHALQLLDFRWSLEVPAPNGDRPTELFSLADVCSDPSSSNQQARIDLQLEGDENYGIRNLLEDPTDRRLSLVAALQSGLKLPATMLYDLESRVSKFNLNMKEPKIILWASFRVASHDQKLVQVLNLGPGMLKANRSVSISPAFGLFDCVSQVAHKQVAMNFAYRPSDSKCLMELPNESKESNTDKGPFKAKNASSADLLLFWADRAGITKLPTVSWLTDTFGSTHRHKLLGLTLSLPTTSDLYHEAMSAEFSTPVPLTIRRLVVDEHDYRSPIDGAEAINIARISSYGLQSEPGSKSWPPPQNSATSPAACRAACLASEPECLSYSVCIRDSRIECLLSGLSFRSREVIAQLMANKPKGSRKLNERVLVELDPLEGVETNGSKQQVELIWSPRCDLYNLLYMDSFIYVERSSLALAGQAVYLAENLEDCADYCYKQTLDALRSESQSILESTDRLARGYSSHSDSELLKQLKQSRESLDLRLCKTFLYTKRVQLDEQQEKNVKMQLVVQPTDEQWQRASGFCIPGVRSGNNKLEQLTSNSNESGLVNFDLYHFRFETFYEKHHGIRLRSSPMSMEERAAYNRLSHIKTHSDNLQAEPDTSLADSLKEARAFIEKGNNIQETLMMSESRCAMACFLQLIGPWPACKSFDLVVEERNERTQVSCKLNSVTLKDVIRSRKAELIDEDTTKKFQVWHFEPRNDIALEEANLATGLALLEKNKEPTAIGLMGMFFLIIFAAANGLILGIYLSNRFLSRRRESKANILASNVIFKNQVNSDGQLPD